MKYIELLFTFALISACTPSDGRTANESDVPSATQYVTLIVNADIITMSETLARADAMAIKGDRIVAVGTEDEVRGSIPRYDRFFDMNGRTIVPGFFETHDHLYLSSGTTLIADISPFTTPTLRDALARLEHLEPDEDGWVVAFGADQTLYEERRGPTRDVLDPLFPKIPVIVFHLSGHAAFMNSEALRRSGLDESTPDPVGGIYERNADGSLTGYLSGQSSFLPYKSYPSASLESAVDASRARAAKGVTTASELGIMNAFVLEGLHEATSDPRFATRMVGGYFSTAPDFQEIVPLLGNYENELLRIPFIKTWTDGSAQGGTAQFRDGYYDESMGGGGAQGTQEYFNEIVLDMYQRGMWPAIHANGDGAVDVALNAIEYAQSQVGLEDARAVRPQIIHAQVTWPDQIERMAQLGVSPTFFTTHVYYWGDLHSERTVGPNVAQRLSAMADAFRAGVHPSMHNDAPVSPVDPIFNMWVAVNRTSSSGQVYGADQAITPRQALEAYTVNAAYQFGMEEDAGSLAAGKLADFVVLDRNPLEIDPMEIRNVRVVATVMGGRITYSDTPKYDRVRPIAGQR